MNMHSRVEVIPKVRPLEDLTVTDPGSCPPHMQTKKRGKEKGKRKKIKKGKKETGNGKGQKGSEYRSPVRERVGGGRVEARSFF